MDKKYIVNFVVFFIVVVVAFFIYQKFMPNLENEEVVKEEFNIEVLQEGKGEEAKIGDTVSVHYMGVLRDGTKFDSSLDREEPFSFTLGENRVIQGWEQGIVGMKVSEKRKLTIPAELGYGEAGIPGGPIPPNATLIFEVELLGIQ